MKITKKRWLVLPLVMSLILCSLSAQDAGLVIQSPLFGTRSVNQQLDQTLQVQTYAQQLGLGDQVDMSTKEERVLSAISNGNYPVTPGDTYRLVYLDGLKTVTVDLQADEKSDVVIPGLGSVKGAGLTYNALKQQMLSMVQTYHSYSNPQLIFTGTGSFTVTVVGEVVGTRVMPVWGLSHLSSVVTNATSYASNRRVTVTHTDGTSKTYDLYKALRKGDLKEDPLLKSGDVISLTRAEKLVMLGGEVYQSGTYQLKTGEKLQDLISSYAGGVLPGSDIQHLRVQRFNANTGSWDVQYVDLFSNDAFELQNNDQVFVDRITPSMSSVTLEGAISSNEAYDNMSSTALLGYASGRIFYQFYPGETVRQMLNTVSVRLLTVSDLDGSYLLRSNERISLKAQQILYGNDPSGEMKLEAGDTFVIPFNQRFVTVGGGVIRSGVYAYVPDKEASYYLALAGGLSDDASYPASIKITGPEGKTLHTDEAIQPESTIMVAKNTFVKDIAPTVAVIGLVSSILGIIAVVIGAMVDAKSL